MNRRLIYLAAIVAAVIFTGCHTHRGAGMPEEYQGASLTAGAVDSILRSGASWQSVEVPVRLSVIAPASMDISGRMKMVRGEVVYISLRMIGFEVGKVMLTPDSLFISVSPKKLYVAEPLAAVSRYVTLSNLQDILTGVPFVAGSDVATSSDFRISSDGVNNILTPRRRVGGADYSWIFSGDTEQAVADIGSASLRADYSFGQEFTPGRPAESAFTLDASGHKLKAAVAMKWGSADFQANPPSPWTAPRGYRRVALADVIKALGK